PWWRILLRLLRTRPEPALASASRAASAPHADRGALPDRRLDPPRARSGRRLRHTGGEAPPAQTTACVDTGSNVVQSRRRAAALEFPGPEVAMKFSIYSEIQHWHGKSEKRLYEEVIE